MMVVNLLKSSVGNDKLKQPHQSMQNSCLFCTKKHIFSILHTYFYKTPTSIYLFYNLFYLNNHFLTFFYYFISNSLYSHMKIQSKHGEKNSDPSTVRNSSLKLRSKHRYSPTHKRWFASADSFFVSIGVFGFMVSVVDFVVDFLFLWLICVCGSVCIRGRRRWWGTEDVLVLQMEKREKKKEWN